MSRRGIDAAFTVTCIFGLLACLWIVTSEPVGSFLFVWGVVFGFLNLGLLFRGLE